jgi:plasmid segregation protein ParM
MTVIGMDIGYHATKVITSHTQHSFPSLVGTADLSRFSAASNHASRTIAYRDRSYLFGEDAVDLSRLVNRREDRGWIDSDEYQILVRAALSYAVSPTTIDSAPISLITGLPLAFYEDKDRLKSQLINIRWLTWRQATRAHHHQVNISPASLRVVPQPFGSLFFMAFEDTGQVVERAILEGQVGIIDIGGKTTNILVASRARDVARASTSVPVGGWDVVRAVQSELSETCRDANLRDHEVAAAVARGSFNHYGREVDLSTVISDVSSSFCETIVSQASQQWGAGAELDTILLSGGGANLVGDQLKAHFHRHADVRVVPDPQLANAIGYYRYGLFVEANR